jgi:ribonucleoside-triphosphate reductase
MDQTLDSKELMKNMIVSCAKKGIVYFAINYILQECKNGHMSVGNIDTCPICGDKIVGRYTRTVGFLTKVENWIKERKELDFPNRQFYKGI